MSDKAKLILEGKEFELPTLIGTEVARLNVETSLSACCEMRALRGSVARSSVFGIVAKVKNLSFASTARSMTLAE